MNLVVNSDVVVGVNLVEEAIEIWRASTSSFPALGRRYARGEQEAREDSLDRCLERIDSLAKRAAPAEQIVSTVISEAVELTQQSLDLEDSDVDRLLKNGFARVGLDMARRARTLDAQVSMIDILQACRNAWTACALQLLFGKPMSLTPAIFAYSMLYPYSDNYLDDATVSPSAKLRFSERFRRRLAGEHLPVEDSREAIIWHLVALIESQYPRQTYPGVYQSLLAIHHAQQESIRQYGAGRSLNVLALSVTKGGASVLADAYLAAGTLSETEARFAFEWGVLLQLSDDLQDVQQDRWNGSTTLFSQSAGREPLDALTNQTFHFGHAVLSRMAALPNKPEILGELLTRSSRSLLIRSAASVPELYTDAYLAELETYSPFRFAFLRARERRVANQRRSYARLFDTITSLYFDNEGSREDEFSFFAKKHDPRARRGSPGINDATYSFGGVQ